MRSLLLSAALLPVALPCSGCCSLARLFCGPDRSEWISVDFDTPEAAVRTFLEALRRDDPEIVYRSLSDDFRRGLGIDESSAELAWPRIRDQNPGLHLAGYAEVPRATRTSPDRARVALDVEGTAVTIDLYRESYWELRYVRRSEGDDGEPRVDEGAYGGRLDAFVGRLRVTALEEEDPGYSEEQWLWRATLEPITFEHYGVDEIALHDVDAFGVYREWKVAALQTRRPD